ncbi:hypothetical protein OG21DRAFT_328461 [Imleria badia]|nr:hypothetical protein OG21DRAFT_328461 [Imleria badia]
METCHFGTEAYRSKNQRIKFHDKRKKKTPEDSQGVVSDSQHTKRGDPRLHPIQQEAFCEKKENINVCISLRIGAWTRPKTQQIQLINANHVCSVLMRMVLVLYVALTQGPNLKEGKRESGDKIRPRWSVRISRSRYTRTLCVRLGNVGEVDSHFVLRRGSNQC